MLTNFHRLCQAVSVTALTVGVAFAAQPAQKASAQTTPAIRGYGSSSVTNLLSSVNGPVKDYVQDPAQNPGDLPFNYSNSYIVTGSGFGRTQFNAGAIDFVATDGPVNGGVIGSGTSAINLNNPNLVVVNQAKLNVVFPYNVKFSNGTNFDVSINTETICRIVRGNTSLGDPVNWNQVTNISGVVGPNLPIRRVVRGDVSGQTATHQGPAANNNLFTDSTLTQDGTYGFVALCNGQANLYPGGPLVNAAPSFGPAANKIPSIVGPGTNGFNDGTNIPNKRNGTTGDIIVNAASVSGNAPADPVAAAAAFGNDNDNNPQLAGVNNPGNFRGSYARGVLNAIRKNNGAFGYADASIANRAIANNSLFPAAERISGLVRSTDLNIGGNTIAVGPTYVIFRRSYPTSRAIIAGQDICYGSIFSGFLGNQAAAIYSKEAGFAIDANVFPYDPLNSPDAGADTDNYGSLGVLDPFDFGPCSKIGK